MLWRDAPSTLKHCKITGRGTGGKMLPTGKIMKIKAFHDH
jgi:hypothetical protein